MTSAEDKAREELARLKGQISGKGRRILAVDPGTAATGICLLVDGEPEWIQVVREKGARAEDRLPAMCCTVSSRVADAILGNDVDTVAIEWQAIREDDPRPNDILHLGMVIGAALAGVPQPLKVKLYTPLPVSWKGSVKGDVFTERIRQRYPAAGDMMHGVPEHLKHNGFDALALAIWAINKALPWRI